MNNYRQSPFANIPPVVKNLLIINVIFYLASRFLIPANIFDCYANFSAFYFDSHYFKPWQVITYMFMHDPVSFWHILGNMFALFIFGPALESMMGSKRFFNFYFICGIGALLCNMLVQAVEIHSIIGAFTVTDWNSLDPVRYVQVREIYDSTILGASGAIFGILIAFGLLFPDVELMLLFLPIPIKAKYFVTFYILFELYSGIRPSQGDSVAHFAHIGGAIFGYMMIKIWGLNRRDNHYY